MTRTVKILGWLLAGCVALCALPAAARSEGSATFGSQWWDQNHPEAKYQEFRDLPRGGFLESFLWTEWSGRNAISLTGVNAARRDQAAKLTYTNGARVRLDLAYAGLPHLYSKIARTPYAEASPGVFTLPDTLQAKNQADSTRYRATMQDLLAGARGQNLTMRTNVSKARLRVRPVMGLQLEANGVLRERSGYKPYGLAFGFNSAIEIVEPIRQRMVDADLVANWQKDRYSVRASVGMSAFQNDVDRLVSDNPKRITDRSTYSDAYTQGTASVRGQTDLYPDNRAIRGNLAVGVQLPRRTALTATVGMAQHQQDDKWLPYTVNTAITQASANPLPGTSTDAKANVTTADVRLTTRAIAKMSGALRFNFHDYANKTEEHSFPGYVRLDQVWEAIPVTSEPFGNRQMTFGADVDYDVMSGVNVGALYELRMREHTLREVEKDKENVFGANLKARLKDGVALDGRFRYGKREADAFNEEDFGSFVVRPATGLRDSLAGAEQPGLRRFDIADRVRNEAGGGVTYAWGDRVDLYAGYSYHKDDYEKSQMNLGTFEQMGLLMSEQHTVTASGTIHAMENLDLEGGYGYGLARTDQQARVSATDTISMKKADDWKARLEDQSVFVFARADYWAKPGKLGFTAGYDFTRGLGKFSLTGLGAQASAGPPPTPAVAAQDLPNTLYRRHDVTAEARWVWVPGTEVIGRYAFERFEVVDFAATNIPLLSPVTGSSNAVYLGAALQNYDAHRVALLVSKKF
jgi:MtrB/PioB family decaheme-associated outer membrane protein